MNNKENFKLAIEDFVRNGGVVLASNTDGVTCVIQGSIEKVLAHFSKAFILMNMSFIEKNPEDFKLFASYITSQLLAIAQIAESKWDVPQLSKDTKHCILMGFCDKASVHLAKEIAKGIMKDSKEA